MDQVKVGAFIARLRKENGLTQQALGDELNVTNKTISRWETGTYMPDIEMFKLLSQRFQVSINELLCGERLYDTSYQKPDDDNPISASSVSAFSLKEKIAFGKNKWLKEHIALLLLCFSACVGLLIYAWMKRIAWLIGISPLLWLVVYGVLRNKMMIYVENQIYGHGNKG